MKHTKFTSVKHMKLNRRWLLIAVLCTLCAGVPLTGITADCWWVWDYGLQTWYLECGSGDVPGGCVGSYTGCEEDAEDDYYNAQSECSSTYGHDPAALRSCLDDAQDDYDRAIADCYGC